MRSEMELLEECKDFFNEEVETYLEHLTNKVDQHLESNNLLTAKYYLADVKTIKNIIVRREIR